MVAALWVWVGLQLSVEWGINPQYSYGWGVPWLALYLFWQRWKDRPAPGRAPSRLAGGGLIALLAASLLPIRLVQEANPDWRLVSIAAAVAVSALTLAVVAQAGGRAWARHFMVVAAFPLLAVPWPTPVENLLTQSLMRGVAAVAVEVVNWCGVPAVRFGNLIHLNNGVIGINEACSGVRSLQATFMAAVFLGELYRLGRQRRVWLVMLGGIVALWLNVVRTLVLTSAAIARGPDAIEAWHDPAGYLILGVAFAALWGLAVWLVPAPRVVRARDSGRSVAPPLPVTWLAGLCLWLVLIEVGTETWYRAHETRLGPRVTWTLRWPTKDAGFRFLPIEEEVRRVLRFSTGQAAAWRRDDGSVWSLFWFRWFPGRAAAQLARSHSPDICLPASGLKFLSAQGVQAVRLQGLTLSFQVSLYQMQGRPLAVFYCLWEDRPSARTGAAELDLLSRNSRFRAVAAGQRHLGQVVLEVAISRAPGVPQAVEALEGFLKDALEVERAAR